jgi:hypothetical protein
MVFVFTMSGVGFAIVAFGSAEAGVVNAMLRDVSAEAAFGRVMLNYACSEAAAGSAMLNVACVIVASGTRIVGVGSAMAEVGTRRLAFACSMNGDGRCKKSEPFSIALRQAQEPKENSVLFAFIMCRIAACSVLFNIPATLKARLG